MSATPKLVGIVPKFDQYSKAKTEASDRVTGNLITMLRVNAIFSPEQIRVLLAVCLTSFSPSELRDTVRPTVEYLKLQKLFLRFL